MERSQADPRPWFWLEQKRGHGPNFYFEATVAPQDAGRLAEMSRGVPEVVVEDGTLSIKSEHYWGSPEESAVRSQSLLLLALAQAGGVSLSSWQFTAGGASLTSGR